MDIPNIIEYWLKSSEEDFRTAEALFSTGRYAHCLFFCHLTIEKMLKALVVKQIGAHAPYSHNLFELSQSIGIKISKEQAEDLKEIDTFNIKGRYDDYKFAFYKKATRDYAEEYFIKTRNLYTWLKKQQKN